MERLCVSYIDIVQCHDIVFVEIEVVLKETLPALQALKQQGKIGFVGITGLPLRVFRRVLDRAPPGLVDVVRPCAACTRLRRLSRHRRSPTAISTSWTGRC